MLGRAVRPAGYLDGQKRSSRGREGQMGDHREFGEERAMECVWGAMSKCKAAKRRRTRGGFSCLLFFLFFFFFFSFFSPLTSRARSQRTLHGALHAAKIASGGFSCSPPATPVRTQVQHRQKPPAAHHWTHTRQSHPPHMPSISRPHRQATLLLRRRRWKQKGIRPASLEIGPQEWQNQTRKPAKDCREKMTQLSHIFVFLCYAEHSR